jgi:hypothetical protein
MHFAGIIETQTMKKNEMIGLAGLVALGVAGYFAYRYFRRPQQEQTLGNENEKHHLTNVFSKAKEYGTRETESQPAVG